jgi:hypothetical protein
MKIPFDPRDFIGPPFKNCPKCSELNFGILSIDGNTYSRRCRNCWLTERFSLPQINKKIIYLDQFAVSDMMKSLNTKHPSNTSPKLKPIWKKLFEKLDRLSQLQLVICPKSFSHSQETQLTSDYTFIKRILDQLSHGLAFKDFQWIKQVQIHENFLHWLDEKKPYTPEINRRKILEGDPNEWTDNLIITVNSKWSVEIIDSLRSDREQLTTSLVQVFEQWAREKKSFEEIVRDEIIGFGSGILAARKLYIGRYLNYLSKEGENNDPLQLLPPSSCAIIETLKEAMKSAKISESEFERNIALYLSDEFIGFCPFLDLNAHLWAAVARKAVSGQKKPPNRGANSDFECISSLIPYCDAMMIDNACAAYLLEEPLKSKFQNYGKIFCQNSADQFLEYLNSIESSAEPSHLQLVREIYGDNVGKPYTDIFDLEKF